MLLKTGRRDTSMWGLSCIQKGDSNHLYFSYDNIFFHFLFTYFFLVSFLSSIY